MRHVAISIRLQSLSGSTGARPRILEPPIMSVATPTIAPFVARQRELSRLVQGLEEALTGKLAVRLVAGEAGAGKTALVTELAHRARARDERIVIAVGDGNAQSGAGDPYLPFREVLSVLVGGAASATPSAADGARMHGFVRLSLRALSESAPDLVGMFVPAGAILARLGGMAARRLPWAERLETSLKRRIQHDAPSAALEQMHLFEQYCSVLRAVSAEHPLLVVLDDLQWVDPGSTGLLFHLSRRLEDCPILLVGTYRPEEVALGRGGERHPLEQVIHELKRYRGEIVIDLEACDEAEDRLRLDALVDLEPNALDVTFRDALFGHTHGHALFTLELLHNLQERGDLVRDARGRWMQSGPVDWRGVPARVEGVIGERIGRLAEELRQMLVVASVEGEDFTAEVVARVRELNERDVVRRLSGDLEKRHRLVNARELRRLGGQRLSMYQFRHNLIQKYLYHTLDDVERRWLHEDVGTVLEALYGESADGAAFQLAGHFEEAGRSDRALHYRLVAGARARAVHANHEAIDHYRRALKLADSVSPPLPMERSCEVNENLADVLELCGRHEEALSAYSAALAIARESWPHTRAARLHRKLGLVHSSLRRADEAVSAYADAERELEVAAVHAEDGCQDEWIQLQVDRLTHNYWLGDWHRMAEVVERAGPIIEAHGSARARAEFWHRQVLMRYRRNRFVPDEETARLVRAARAVIDEAGDPDAGGLVRFGVGFDALWARDTVIAETHLRDTLAVAKRTGDFMLEMRCVTYLAVARRFLVDVAGTRTWAQEALRMSRSVSALEYVGSAEANLAWVAYRENDHHGAVRRALSALEYFAAPGLIYPLQWLAIWPLIAASLELGDVARAGEHAQLLLSLPAEQRMSPPVQDALEHAAAAVQAGDPAAAVALAAAVTQARAASLV
jgi:tetratricopeptide (TPR) repeat protein